MKWVTAMWGLGRNAAKSHGNLPEFHSGLGVVIDSSCCLCSIYTE